MAHDKTTGKASITLLFPYVSFILAMVSITLLLKENTLYGAMAAIGVWVVSLVLYLMRRLTKVKFDLDDKSIDLENSNDEEKSNS